MVKNLGSADRIIRLIVGLVLIGLPLLSSMALFDSSTMKIVSMAIGVILAGTALFRFCPIYRILGLRTCKV
ncbi:hypothetical protein MNBD_ALPHA07-2084 [hydrothermal vent metagenome]|uniref:Inner membrane protein YgaP-like transmembrane domain-containing protein n=1 Tax=hydrothermal vent metagenome TaxID=652676 RepID=A0A3B0RM04_9ZZZZ